MKKFRLYIVFDWILVAISYIAALFLYNGGILYNKNPDTVEVMNPLCIAGLVFYGILTFLQFFIYILGIVFPLTSKDSIAKHNMIVKLATIPFFVINFIALYFLSINVTDIHVGLLAVTIPLSVIFTFFIMFRTSLPNVVYFIKSYIKKTLKVTPWAIIALISSFIFLLDVVGGIILFKHERNQRPDIAERIREKRLQKIEKWKTEKHKSLLSLKIKSIITFALISVSSIVPLVIVIVKFASAIANGGTTSIHFEDWFIFLPLVACVVSLIKFIIGIRYGKHGEEDPISFMFVMKMMDILPTTALLLIALFCLITGAIMDLMAVFLISCIVVVVVIFVIIALLGGSVIVYMSSALPMLAALLCIWSSSLTVFTYYINQRAMKNRKFSNPLIIVCLVCLWIPILDIPAMIILKNKSKINGILGDKPVIVVEEQTNQLITNVH